MARTGKQTWIIGLGEARSAPKRDDLAINELAWEAISPALEDAGVALSQITGAATASQDFWDGRTISSMNVNELVGGTTGSEAKVAADGAQALAYAAARIADDDQHLNLVLAHAKESQGDPHAIEIAAFDPFFERQLDPDETVLAGLQAQQLYATGEFTPQHAAEVLAACRSRSEVLEHITAEQVLASPLSASPLHELDRAPFIDAAAALVVCSDSMRQALKAGGVRVAATSSRTSAYWSQRESLHEAPLAGQAAQEALALAGWSIDDVDYMELNTPYSTQQLIVAKALGLGGGEELVRRLRSDAAINPSGGWLAGAAGGVAGLRSVVRMTRLLRQRPSRALIYSTTGLCLQSHHIVLLESSAEEVSR